MEPQKTQDRQKNPEKTKQRLRYHTSLIQIIFQSDNN